MNMKKRTDYIHTEWLVLRCQGGDEAALKELITLWQKRLGRIVWRLTDGHPDGEDIVQTVWLTVVRKLKRLDEPAAFPLWLYRIAAATCANWVRKKQRERKMKATAAAEVTTEMKAPQVDDDRHTAKSLIRHTLSRLPSHQRLILTLFYVDELSTLDIAHVLDIPVGTVKSRLFYARNELRKQVERST
jgi:RNA polymerase sigma-70 factor, ECF subfamily